MSVQGLVRKPHYEEVLNAAIKDESSQHGILSVPMQRFATKAINNPLFQRVQATLSEKLETEQKQVLEQRGFEHNIQRLSVEAKVSHEDLKWLVENLQQPPPPPPPPPPAPASDSRVNYERVAAEMDGVLQGRAWETSHEALGVEVERRLAAQSVATPAQQIIREHHHHFVTQPVPLPVPAVPTTVTEEARHTGKSIHEVFVNPSSSSTGIPTILFPQREQRQMEVQQPRVISSEEFPMEFQRPQMVQSGSVKHLKQKFEKKTPPPSRVKITPPPGGGTSPMPIPAGGYPAAPSIEIAPPPPEAPRIKRKAARQSTPVSLKPRQPRGDTPRLPGNPPFLVPFSGRAHRLPIENNFSARPQRLPDENNLRANAIKRMKEIADRVQQHTTRKQDFEKRSQMEKKMRRGGAPGDVVPLGKRKQPESDAPQSILRKSLPPEPQRARQRLYGPRTQVFNMDQPVAVR